MFARQQSSQGLLSPVGEEDAPSGIMGYGMQAHEADALHHLYTVLCSLLDTMANSHDSTAAAAAVSAGASASSASASSAVDASTLTPLVLVLIQTIRSMHGASVSAIEAEFSPTVEQTAAMWEAEYEQSAARKQQQQQQAGASASSGRGGVVPSLHVRTVSGPAPVAPAAAPLSFLALNPSVTFLPPPPMLPEQCASVTTVPEADAALQALLYAPDWVMLLQQLRPLMQPVQRLSFDVQMARVSTLHRLGRKVREQHLRGVLTDQLPVLLDSLSLVSALSSRHSSQESARYTAMKRRRARMSRRRMTTWMWISRNLTNERGPWSQHTPAAAASKEGAVVPSASAGASAKRVYWKLDEVENLSRMRMKLQINYHGHDHHQAAHDYVAPPVAATTTMMARNQILSKRGSTRRTDSSNLALMPAEGDTASETGGTGGTELGLSSGSSSSAGQEEDLFNAAILFSKSAMGVLSPQLARAGPAPGEEDQDWEGLEAAAAVKGGKDGGGSDKGGKSGAASAAALALAQAQSVVEADVELITFRERIYGRFMLTSTHLYFEAKDETALPPAVAAEKRRKEAALRRRRIAQGLPPSGGPHSETNVSHDRSWLLSHIVSLHYRRHQLRRCALELFFDDHTCVFFAFANEAARNGIHSKLLRLIRPFVRTQQARLLAAAGGAVGVPSPLAHMGFIYAGSSGNYGIGGPWGGTAMDVLKKSGLVQAWRTRKISNFDYIMALNTISGRTYNDLTQYPVFPWVIADYTSSSLDLDDPLNSRGVFRDLTKPVGALNPDRLRMFIDRYHSLDDPDMPKFQYGTHYSSSGSVLFYLLRVEPFTTAAVELQDGRFDHSDRLFHCLHSDTRVALHSSTSIMVASSTKGSVASSLAAHEVRPGMHLVGDHGQAVTVARVDPVPNVRQMVRVTSTTDSFLCTLEHRLTLRWNVAPAFRLEHLSDHVVAVQAEFYIFLPHEGLVQRGSGRWEVDALALAAKEEILAEVHEQMSVAVPGLLRVGDLFEVTAAELLRHWDAWCMDSNEQFASGYVVPLPQIIPLPAGPLPSLAPQAQATFDAFDSSAREVARAGDDGVLLEHFALRSLGAGQYGHLAAGDAVRVVYQLQAPLNAADYPEEPYTTRILHASSGEGTDAHTFLRLDALHAQLGVDEEAAALVVAEMNAKRDHHGAAPSLALEAAYDRVCLLHCAAMLALGAERIVAFGRYSHECWMQFGAMLSDAGTEPSGECTTSSGVRFMQLTHAGLCRTVFFSPHPAATGEAHAAQLVATLLAAHELHLPSERVGQIIAFRSGRDRLLSATLEERQADDAPFPVTNIEIVPLLQGETKSEVAGSRRFALSTGVVTHNSIPATWEGVNTNPADVKELIPEFFYLPEFLKNGNGIDFGTKQKGERIGDVILPPWARGSAEEFVRINRAALESEYVSLHLHAWIDLIFGFKQQGRAALEANNVFFHLTYEGAVDIDAIADATLRDSTIAQIEHFGQTPSQLFTQPHVTRMAKHEQSDNEIPTLFQQLRELQALQLAAARGTAPPQSPLELQRLMLQLYTVEQVTASAATENPLLFLALLPASNRLLSIGLDRVLALHKFQNTIQEYIPPFLLEVDRKKNSQAPSLGPAGTSGGGSSGGGSGSLVDALSFMGGGKPGAAASGRRVGVHFTVGLNILPFFFCVSLDQRFLLSCGHWDNSFRVTAIDSGVNVHSVSAHKDIVTCLALSEAGDFLVTGSKDTTVCVWAVAEHVVDLASHAAFAGQPNAAQAAAAAAAAAAAGELYLLEQPVHILYGHDDEVTCCAVSSELDVVVSGSRDGTVMLHTLRSGRYTRTITPPEQGSIRWVGVAATGCVVSYSLHDLALHVWSINGTPLGSCDTGERLYALRFSRDGAFLLAGGDRKQLTVYDLQAPGGRPTPVHRLSPTDATIRSIALTKEEQHVLLGTATGKLYVYGLNADYLRTRFLKRLSHLGL